MTDIPLSTAAPAWTFSIAARFRRTPRPVEMAVLEGDAEKHGFWRRLFPRGSDVECDADHGAFGGWY